MVTIDLLQQAKQYFDLQPPFSLFDLKKAYRAAAKKIHPDSSQEDTTHEFIKVKACYDALVTVTEDSGATKQSSSFEKTTDGTFLHELGLGLGPMKNGIDCSHCEHRGYTQEKGLDWDLCTTCEGSGRVRGTFSCRYCVNGKFTQRSGRVVDCRACNGSGKFHRGGRTERCLDCQGSGCSFKKKTAFTYRKCYKCNGAGEVEIFNPVIVKGRLLVRS